MAKRIVDPGKVFNNWTTIRFVERRGQNFYWLFRCKCGNERVLQTSSVTSNKSKSCGCVGYKRSSKEEQRVNSIFKQLRQNSIRRKKTFILLKSDITALAEKQQWRCAQTGILLDLTTKTGKKRPFGPTIDRIDNARGYEPDNIQLVCNLYNFCKNEFTDDDVLTFADALVKHQRNLAKSQTIIPFEIWRRNQGVK